MPMRRPIVAAVVALAAVLALGGGLLAGSSQAATPSPQAAPAAVPACTGWLATNPYLQTRLVTTSDASTYTSTAYVPMACGTTAVSVPRGRRGLIVVGVDAEVTCTGPAGQWCLGQVLIGGVVGQPSAPEPDSLAWAHSTPDAAAWEANTFTRTRFVACPSTAPAAGCSCQVQVQVRTHADGLLLRVDDSTVHAQVTYY
jgi:hypothetical protein